MLYASTLRRWCREQSRERLVARFPHPWLVIELADEERHTAPDLAIPDGRPQPSGAVYVPLAFRLHREPERYALHAIEAHGDPARVVIGRHEDCDIVLPDATVSKVHAALERDADGGWVLIDLDSANGTRVDGVPVAAHEPVLLHSGVRLGFGRRRAGFLDGIALWDILSAERVSSRWLHA